MGNRVFSETSPIVVGACGALRPSEPDLIFETLLTLLPITSVGILSLLTSLRRLQIAGLERSDQSVTVEHWTVILERIMVWIPSTCKIELGAVTETQHSHVREMAEKLGNRESRVLDRDVRVREADVAVMRKAATEASQIRKR
jgi:hypothetical protein